MSEQELGERQAEPEATPDAGATAAGAAPEATGAETEAEIAEAGTATEAAGTDASPAEGSVDRPTATEEPAAPVDPSETQAPQPNAQPKPLFCRKCGAAIPEGQPFCGQCGTPVNGPVAGAHATATHAAKLPGGLPKQALVGIAVAVVAVVAIVVLATGALSPKPDPEPEPFDFTEEFSDYEGESWCTFGDDGSYMTIDTNPYDISDYIDFDAMQAIEDVNDKLGFPDSTLENMNHTRALDGTQTDEVDGFEVSWRFHPDSGMEVTYERTDSATAEGE